MIRILLILRTVRHLKGRQVWDRLWRRRLALWPWRCAAGGACDGVRRMGVRALVAWPPGGTVWDGGTAFTFLGATHAVKTPADWTDASRPRLWRYNLHYFDCLRQRPPSAAAASCLVRRWIAENPVGCGDGWEPYPVSLRIVNWIKWLTAGDGQAPDEPRKDIEQSLHRQVAWLARRLEYHLLANHLLANAKALVFAGMFFEGAAAERWYRTGMAIYRKELPGQILGDGVHFELSAMYHALIFEDLLDVVNLLHGTGGKEKDAEFLAAYAGRMRAGLELLTGPDGRLAKFNDAADGIAFAPADLMAYADRLGVTGALAGNGPDSGYVRLAKGAWTLIAKCGAIGPSYQPGHAHADSLTFELWRGADKIVADTGTDRYEVDAERIRQRGTAAHNTVTVDGADSSEVWRGHRVARRARPLQLTVDAAAGRIAARCRDYRGFVHSRTLTLTADGLCGTDTVEGAGRHAVVARFHFVPEADGRYGFSGDAPLRWEDCALAVEFGKLCVGRCAVLERTGMLPARFEWNIR